MKIIITILTIFLSSQLLAEKKKFDPHIKIQADSAQQNIQILMDELAISHPGFYRYTSKAEFDYLIDSTKQTIVDSIGTIEYYRKLKPLMAKIGCLHSGISFSEEFEKYLNNRFKLLPLEIFIDERDQVFVTKSYASTNLRIKSELLRINGKPIGEILSVIYKAIPSDGYNKTLKTLLLNHRFAFWYQTMIQVDNQFLVELKSKGQIEQYELAGVSPEVFPSMKELQRRDEPQLVFSKENDVGYLTVRSFAKSNIKRSGQKFEKFINKTFDTLEEESIDQLVIDVRYNSGGSDSHAAHLTSLFFDEPFDYWDKIEVTKKIAKQIKGINRLFYRKPKMVDSTYLWQGSALYKEFDFYHLNPGKPHFNGDVYLVTNGLCMSSCADFVAILSANQKAKVVGQETGGGFQGNTSGLMPTAPIHPNIEITLPLLKYTNAVDMNKNFGRGTIPDHPINPTLGQWLLKEDVEMNYVNELLTK